MKTFNITAQVYKRSDLYKQTLLINDTVNSSSKESAIVHFYDTIDDEYNLVKIYSVEEISKVVS